MLTPLARSRTRPMAVAIVAVLAAIGLFPIDPTLEFLLATAMAWAVAAVGLDVFSGYLGQPSFGHAGFVALGAYGYAILAGSAHLAPGLAAACAIALVAAVAAAIGLALLRLRDFGLVLGTFFLSYAVTSVVSGTTFGSVTHAESGLQVPAIAVGSTNLSHGKSYYYLCAVTLLIAVTLTCNYSDSRSGRALRLVKRSEVVARTLGVAPRQTKLAAFTYSAALAATAGILIGIGAGYIAPENFTAQQSIILFGMVAVGGLGSVAGPVLGALLFTLAPNYLQAAKTYQDIFFAALLLGAIILFRDGLFGLVEKPLRMTAHRLRLRGNTAGRRPHPDLPVPHDEPSLPERAGGQGVLDIDGLVVDYGGVRALDGVSFAVAEGDVHALVGPNGAGKTTLLNCVSGLEAARTGDICVQGRPVALSGSPNARRIGVSRTFQNPSLVPDLTCVENVMLGLHLAHRARLTHDLLGLRRGSERAVRDKASKVLDFVGVPPHRHDTSAAEVSLAEAKLVDIARAVAMDGCVLVMDEPTAGLSGPEMSAVSKVISRLRTRLTVLVVSHHVGWVKDVAQVVTVLAAGKVIASGDPGDVFSRPLVREVFVGDRDESAPAGTPGTGAVQ